MTAGKGKFGPLVGAIDEGTSSARFMIFKAQSFEVVCHHQEEVPQIYPQEGWVEQDPEKILTVVLNCIEGALKKLEELGGRKEVISFMIYFSFISANSALKDDLHLG